MSIGFQIGQCRISVDTEETKRFYQSAPKISENCKCGDCEYFEKIITDKDIRLLKILKSMGVDLTRQPNINPDGICSVGPTKKYERAYFGYYQVLGHFDKTQKTPQTIVDGKLTSVDFFETDEDSHVQYQIKQETEDKLNFEFYLECEKIHSSTSADTRV